MNRTIRRQRAGVEDRWFKNGRDEHGNKEKVPSATHGKGKRWRARYVDDQGKEHAKGFGLKAEAQRWLRQQTANGTHVAPRQTVTVEQWCATWLEGYQLHRPNSVAAFRYLIARVVDEFGQTPLSALRPSAIKAWTAKLAAEGLAASTIYDYHVKLSQILADALHDGVLSTNPCSRRTSPPAGKQKPYVITTEQLWDLYDAMPEHLRVAVLLGAFAGLRVSEAAELQVADVDFIRGVVHPKQQWSGKPLKTARCNAPVPIPAELTLELAASVHRYGTDYLVTDGRGSPAGPRAIEKAIRDARTAVDGLPEKFTFHDLRHYLASFLIADGVAIKTVQATMRHANARTTLDVYGHLWPDSDEAARASASKVLRSGRAAAVPRPKHKGAATVRTLPIAKRITAASTR